MSALSWLTQRPIAHRGLFDSAAGRIENTLGAAEAAIARDFAIEFDVQFSADGEAVVFHDFSLDRLMEANGGVGERTVVQLQALGFKGSNEKISTLAEFLASVAGRVPLICEIKSRFDGDMRLTDRTRAVVADYSGPLALKSFDPAVIAHLRAAGCGRPLGIIAEASYEGEYWRELSAEQKQSFAAFTHFSQTRPDFLSWNVDDLPHPTPVLLRALTAMPIMVWTVTTPQQRRRAKLWADQIIFDGAPD